MTERINSHPYRTEAEYRQNGNGFGEPVNEFEPEEPSLGTLFSDLSHNFSVLVRDEIHLAQVEMSKKAKKVGKDVAYIAMGGFVAYAGFLMLLVAAIIGLSYFMWDWLAALLVGGVVTIIGASVAMRGLKDLKNINPAPRKTLQTLQEDKEWIKEQVR